MVLDEASEKRAEDAADGKGAVGEAVCLRRGAIVAKDARVFFFFLVDCVSELGEAGGGNERGGEADED